MPQTSDLPRRIQVIDSHTAGEPTRCVISGGPELGGGSVAERLERMRSHHDVYRRAILLRAARLRRPGRRTACGTGQPRRRDRRDLLQQRRLSRHVRPRHHRRGGTLRTWGESAPGQHRSETPVGMVGVELDDDGRRDRSTTSPAIAIARTSRWTCRATARSPAMSPGAATGSSSSTTIAR